MKKGMRKHQEEKQESDPLLDEQSSAASSEDVRLTLLLFIFNGEKM